MYISTYIYVCIYRIDNDGFKDQTINLLAEKVIIRLIRNENKLWLQPWTLLLIYLWYWLALLRLQKPNESYLELCINHQYVFLTDCFIYKMSRDSVKSQFLNVRCFLRDRKECETWETRFHRRDDSIRYWSSKLMSVDLNRWMNISWELKKSIWVLAVLRRARLI